MTGVRATDFSVIYRSRLNLTPAISALVIMTLAPDRSSPLARRRNRVSGNQRDTGPILASQSLSPIMPPGALQMLFQRLCLTS